MDFSSTSDDVRSPVNVDDRAAVRLDLDMPVYCVDGALQSAVR
jgi:hypothetical protein